MRWHSFPETGDDPVTGPGTGRFDPARRLRRRDWVGLAGLSCVIAITAVAVPALIAPQSPHHNNALGSGAASGATPSVATSLTWPASASPTPAHPTGMPSGGGDPPAPSTSPTARHRPSAPPILTPISIQAEDQNNTLVGGAGIASCSTCDGGARVRYIGGANELIVHLTMPVGGTRTVTVIYESDGYRTLKVGINDGTIIVRSVTGTDWDQRRVLQFTADIPAGKTSLTFFNDTSPAPDIDKVTLS